MDNEITTILTPSPLLLNHLLSHLQNNLTTVNNLTFMKTKFSQYFNGCGNLIWVISKNTLLDNARVHLKKISRQNYFCIVGGRFLKPFLIHSSVFLICNLKIIILGNVVVLPCIISSLKPFNIAVATIRLPKCWVWFPS